MHKKKITPTGALLYVFLTVVLVFMMIPFVWLLISSLRPNADLFKNHLQCPKRCPLKISGRLWRAIPCFCTLQIRLPLQRLPR